MDENYLPTDGLRLQFVYHTVSGKCKSSVTDLMPPDSVVDTPDLLAKTLLPFKSKTKLNIYSSDFTVLNFEICFKIVSFKNLPFCRLLFFRLYGRYGYY
jgi:hypothetical protein